mgnify:CR=1 FL=1
MGGIGTLGYLGVPKSYKFEKFVIYLVIEMKELYEFVEWLKEQILSEAWSTISMYKAGDKLYCYVDGGLEQEISLKVEKPESKEGGKK